MAPPAPSENTELAVIGGRKKRYAPKVRTGCITCRKRRVKCDEGKPVCLKCTNLGYKCDGYAPLKTWFFEPGAKKTDSPTEKKDTPKEVEDAIQQALTKVVAAAPSDFTFTADEFRSIQFYLRRSGNIVAKYNQSRFDFWAMILPQAAHQYDSLKHALVATALQDELLTAPTTIANIERRIDYHYHQSLQKLLADIESTKRSPNPPILNVLLNSLVMFYFESLKGDPVTVMKHLDAARRIIDEWKDRGSVATPSERLLINTMDDVVVESRIYARCQPTPALNWHPFGRNWEEIPISTPYESEEDAQHALIASMTNTCKPTGQFPLALVRANAFLDVWTTDYQACRTSAKDSPGKAGALERLSIVAKRLIQLLDDGSTVDVNDRWENVLEAIRSIPDSQLGSIQYRKPLTAVTGLLKQRAQTGEQLRRVAELKRCLHEPVLDVS